MNYSFIPVSQGLKQLKDVYDLLGKQERLQDTGFLKRRLLEMRLKELRDMEFYGGPTGIVPPSSPDFITTEGGVTITTESGEGLVTE
jgi:hypothetical protein